MADKPSWQGQSMKKGGAPVAVGSMADKIYPMGKAGQMHSKIAASTYPLGRLVTGTMNATGIKLADGGDVSEAADKAAGMEASKGESIGFFERLRMGNIDDPNSEAYKRLGAGRAKADREMDAAIKSFEGLPSVSGKEEVKPAEPEAPKMTAADFQRTDKDTTPVAMPKPAARPAKSNAMRASAGKPAAPSQSLSQRLGREFADLEMAAQRAEGMPEATLESRKAVRKLADEKRRAYEAAADSEKTGRSVVLKR